MADDLAKGDTVMIERPTETLPPLNALSIIQTAIERGVKGDELNKFVDAVDRLEKRKAEQAFADALSRCQAEMPRMVRNTANEQTHSMYAQLDQIQDKIVPVYTRHGFSLSFGTGAPATPGDIRVEAMLLHQGGHSQLRFVDLPPDGAGIAGRANKTPMHARASTITYGQRYLTVLIFNLQLARLDQDGNAPLDSLIAAEVEELVDALKAKGCSVHRLLVWATKKCGMKEEQRFTDLVQLPRAIFPEALAIVRNFKGEAK